MCFQSLFRAEEAMARPATPVFAMSGIKAMLGKLFPRLEELVAKGTLWLFSDYGWCFGGKDL